MRSTSKALAAAGALAAMVTGAGVASAADLPGAPDLFGLGSASTLPGADQLPGTGQMTSAPSEELQSELASNDEVAGLVESVPGTNMLGKGDMLGMGALTSNPLVANAIGSAANYDIAG